MARLIVDAGLIITVSLISTYRSAQAATRSLFEAGDFVGVFVDAPLYDCIRRATQGAVCQGNARGYSGSVRFGYSASCA